MHIVVSILIFTQEQVLNQKFVPQFWDGSKIGVLSDQNKLYPLTLYSQIHTLAGNLRNTRAELNFSSSKQIICFSSHAHD